MRFLTCFFLLHLVLQGTSEIKAQVPMLGQSESRVPKPQYRKDSRFGPEAVWIETQPGNLDLDAGRTPEVIRRAPVEIKNKWRQVQSQLDRATDPSPERAELLVQRGHLLLAVHSRARAMRDFQRAANVLVTLTSGEPDVESYREMLEKHRYPDPLTFPSKSELKRLYAAGYHAFWFGNYEQAISFFDQAIDIKPHEPTSYYYRALACWKLGREAEAVEFARSGAFWEFQAIRSHWPEMSSNHTSYISEQLSRVQGGWRMWLEQYRTVARRSLRGALPQKAVLTGADG